MIGSLETTLISICKTMPRAKETLRLENGRLLVMPPIDVELEALFEVEGIDVRAKISVKMRTRVVKIPMLRLKIAI